MFGASVLKRHGELIKASSIWGHGLLPNSPARELGASVFGYPLVFGSRTYHMQCHRKVSTDNWLDFSHRFHSPACLKLGAPLTSGLLKTSNSGLQVSTAHCNRFHTSLERNDACVYAFLFVLVGGKYV